MRFIALIIISVFLSACSFPWQEEVDTLKEKTGEKIDQAKVKADQVKSGINETKEDIDKKIQDVNNAVDKIDDAKSAVNNVISTEKEEDNK